MPRTKKSPVSPAASAPASAAGSRFRAPSGITRTQHKIANAKAVDHALRTLEGATGKDDDLATDALAVWLPVAKRVASDAPFRAEFISRLADKFDADIFWVSTLFRSAVAKGAIVHPGAYSVTFTAKAEPKVKYLEGTRTIPDAQYARAGFLQALSGLAKVKTEDSALALAQEVLADMADAGLI